MAVGLPSRSMGMKLFVVSGLALLMTIPAMFVWLLIQDRTTRAADVVREISGQVGGAQTFLGPTLAIPYVVPAQSLTAAAQHGVYLVFPAQATANVKTTTLVRHLSLFAVPVFQADLQLDASFDLHGVPAFAPAGAQLDWRHAELVVGVSDARGAQSDALLTVDGKTVVLEPAATAQQLSTGSGPHFDLAFFGAPAADVAKPDAQFKVRAALKVSGAQRIAVLAYGKTTHLNMQGDWPSPGFANPGFSSTGSGGFMPVTRNVSNHGFTAEWSVPFIARGVPAEGDQEAVMGLSSTGLAVSFVAVADPYQSVSRSVKYAVLFLGLIFLSYFVFEVTSGRRIHPAQYVLVGMAQSIFYLLLLSLAERIGFDIGFLLAGAATVTLLAVNAAWVFHSRPQGFRAAAVFSLLYLLIYLLLRLEDNALMIGALTSFLAVAAAMYFTRSINWYSTLPATASEAAHG